MAEDSLSVTPKATDAGRSRQDNRQFVQAVLWIARSGAAKRNNTNIRSGLRHTIKVALTKSFALMAGGPRLVNATLYNPHKLTDYAKDCIRWLMSMPLSFLLAMFISNECLLFAPRMGRLSATIICYGYKYVTV
jgi:hypothetical protein